MPDIMTSKEDPLSSYRPAKPARVLACVLCQQRKVKCNREFPCTNCIKSRAQCVPATQLARRRRRRLSGHDLLGRLRHYEELLDKNNIPFESIDEHGVSQIHEDIGDDGMASTIGMSPGVPTTQQPESQRNEAVFETKSFWDALNQRSVNPKDSNEAGDLGVEDHPSFDQMPESVVTKAWEHVRERDDLLLFGARKTDADLSTMHPSHAHIFKLWQIYLDNVNSLLKVTHVPTLQAQIIDVVGDLNSIEPNLEALMFGVYCIAIMSIDDQECATLLGSTKKELLGIYQTACQQALLKCNFLRSSSRDCLTALFFYIISVRPDTHPQSLSPILAIAFRIAQRMSISSESANAKHGYLEGEMRRRLWWSLVLIDSRICELSDFKATMLIPTWDCRIPLNVNDFDLRPGMKLPAKPYENLSEALFAVVRGEMGEFIRLNTFYLDFINPVLKTLANGSRVNPPDSLAELETYIEKTYLVHCDPESPLHYMTIWWTHHHIAKYAFLVHSSRYAHLPTQQTPDQLDTAISYAIRMLECDTKLMSSPLTQPYRWLINFHFPFPAYVRIIQNIQKRPHSTHTARAWDVMNENYAVRIWSVDGSDNPFFNVFVRTALQAWALMGADTDLSMIEDMKRRAQQTAEKKTPYLEPSMDAKKDFYTQPGAGLDAFLIDPAQSGMDGLDNFDWTGIDWNLISGEGW